MLKIEEDRENSWGRIIMNKDSRKYYHDLKLFLPIHGTKEKHLFMNFKLRLQELNESAADITYEQICEKLGTPQEVVSEYFFNSDAEYLAKRLRFTGYVRKIFISILIALMIIVSVRSYYLHLLYEEIHEENESPTYIIETIE